MTNATPNDAVNHPSHYTQYPVEVIELTRHMSFNRGNAVKYVARAGFKGGPEKELEDINKAIWYLNDEKKQLEEKQAKQGLISDGEITADKIQSSPISTTTVNMTIHPSAGLDSEEVLKRIMASQIEANFTKGLWHGNSDDKKVQG